MAINPIFDVELMVPLSTDGRSPFAPSCGLPLTQQMAEEQNAKASADAMAQLQLQRNVAHLLACEGDRRKRMLRKPNPVGVAPADRPLTKKEAAALLGVSERTVSRMVDDGELHVIKYGKGGMCRFNREEVERLRAVDKTAEQDDDDDFITQQAGG
jgi:excisionase family DNA binding protein